MLGLVLGVGVTPLRRPGSSWWATLGRLLDAKPASLCLDAVGNRFRLSGGAATISDLLVVSSGSKRVIGPTGTLDTVAANAPAWDWSSGRRRLLVEAKPATKYGGYSEAVAANWGKYAVTASGATSLGPDGTAGLSEIVETATTAWHYTNSPSVGTADAAGEYWASQVVLKKGVGGRYAAVSWAATTTFGGYVGCVVDLTTGSIVSTFGSPGRTAIRATANGGFRVEITSVTTAAGSVGLSVQMLAGSTFGGANSNYAGDGVSSIFAGYVNIEKVASSTEPPSSYVTLPASAAVTRIADDVRFTAAALAIVKSSDVTIAIRASRLNTGASYGILFAADNSGNTVIRSVGAFSSGQAMAQTNGPLGAYTPVVGPAAETEFGVCARFNASGVALSQKGSALASMASSGIDPSTLSVARLGNRSGSLPMNLLLDEVLIWTFVGSDAGIRAQARVWS